MIDERGEVVGRQSADRALIVAQRSAPASRWQGPAAEPRAARRRTVASSGRSSRALATPCAATTLRQLAMIATALAVAEASSSARSRRGAAAAAAQSGAGSMTQTFVQGEVDGHGSACRCGSERTSIIGRRSAGEPQCSNVSARSDASACVAAVRTRLSPAPACMRLKGGDVPPAAPSAAMTRSGGNVTMTSVPIAQLGLQREGAAVQVHRGSWRSAGRGRCPCSADLIALVPWPNEASTIGISSSGMPGPLSFTLMYWPPDAVQPTLSQTSPPCGVNLIALDSRLRQICRQARSSAHSRGSSGSNASWMVMPRLRARSFSRRWQSSTTQREIDRFLVEFVAARPRCARGRGFR